MLPSIPHRIKWPLVFIALWLGIVMTVWPRVGGSQAVRSPDEISRVLVIETLGSGWRRLGRGSQPIHPGPCAMSSCSSVTPGYGTTNATPAR